MTNKLKDVLTKELLTQKYEELKSVNRIAKDLKKPFRTVEKYMILYGISTENKSQIKDRFSKEYLQKVYAEVGTIQDMMPILDISKPMIIDLMRFHKIDYKKAMGPYTADDDFFSRDNEESFYWAGFIAADGCVKEKGKSRILNVGLSKKDENHLIKLKNSLQATNPLTYKIIKNSERNPDWNDTEACEIRISSAKMFSDLSRFNIAPRKTLIYKMPDWLMTHEYLHHFLRGYNDGDGSFYINKQENKADQMAFSLRGNPETFLLQIREILENKCNLPHREKPIRISSGHGVLEYGGNILIGKLANYLYKDHTICLDRKYEKIKHLLDT